MKPFEKLFRSLSTRKRPEDVADIILSLMGGELRPDELALLNKAAKGSLKRNWIGYTSMLQDFSRAIGAERQITKAIELFNLPPAAEIDYNHAGDIERFILEVSPLIHKSVGANNFVADRLNKAERKAAGLDLSKRRYNKKWRLLKRLEKKLLRFRREQRKVEFAMLAKHGLAHRIDRQSFMEDRNTACFIAYFTARCNRRSVFTNQQQSRAFDEVSDMLFKRCLRGDQGMGRRASGLPSGTNWSAISFVYPDQLVLARLTDIEKGVLLGTWTEALQDIASMLAEVWQGSNIQRKTMIVRRGNDSTSWNATAGAWNKARDNWMNLLYAMGMEYMLREVCFGKVMRLMAADVAAWHRLSGGRLSPDTVVWNELPLPWEVFNGEAVCTLEMVRNACQQAGVDPQKSGWVAPRKHGVGVFTPTPELVHGVSIANPFLAKVLKRHKYFSGKKGNPIVPEMN